MFVVKYKNIRVLYMAVALMRKSCLDECFLPDDERSDRSLDVISAHYRC